MRTLLILNSYHTKDWSTPLTGHIYPHLPGTEFAKFAKQETHIKDKAKMPGNSIARETPPVQEIILPEQPVAMDSPEYHQLMRQRLQNHFIEKDAAKVKH
jgi:hypothetical protein